MSTYSKATLFGRPLHPMLVGFPVILYLATVVGFAVHAVEHDPRWFQVGLLCNAAAVVAALVAALPGFVDYALAIQRGTAAKRTATRHMIANLSALALFAANVVVHRYALVDAYYGRIDRFGVLDPLLPLALTVSGIALVFLAGALGYRLVHRYHVADVPTPGASRPGPGSARPISHH